MTILKTAARETTIVSVVLRFRISRFLKLQSVSSKNIRKIK